MRRTTFFLLLAFPLSARLATASPNDARYAEDPDDLFWFLVTADVHTGENLWGGTQDTENLTWLVGEAFQTIRPRFIFICGDLVDATHGGLIPKNQSSEEWSQYRNILDASGMTAETLVDIPGNHDQYCDKGLTFFKKYSIQGSSDGKTQHSLIHHGLAGDYHFLAVATPANDGACWPADNASLDPEELDFIRQAFNNNQNARLHFAFGHHGVKWGSSNKVGEGAKDFLDLLQQYNVSAYFWGHTHEYFSEFHDGILFFNVRSLGKSDDRNVALAAVDHDSLSVRAFTARKWPFVLITAPADKSLGKGNPYAYVVPRTWSAAPVRALVFSQPSPQSVKFRVDNGPWTIMTEVRPGVYQATMNAAALPEGEHSLRVRADPWSDADHEIRFIVGITVCINGMDDDNDGLIDYPDDPGCENPADNDEYNTNVVADMSPEMLEPNEDTLAEPATPADRASFEWVEETIVSEPALQNDASTPHTSSTEPTREELQTQNDSGRNDYHDAPQLHAESEPQVMQVPHVGGGCQYGGPSTVWLVLPLLGIYLGCLSFWRKP